MASSRREFIKKSVFASSGSLLVPGFLKAYEQQGLYFGNAAVNQNGKILVVLQLSGGNDGLNTVVPFNNDIYYRERPQISIAKSEVLKATDELGFNPSMASFKQLFDDGLATIINNVGYPNPDRSHFRSMDIWQTASASNEYLQTGWLGRYLDAACKDAPNPHKAIEVDDSLSLSMKGSSIKGLAMRDPKKLQRIVSGRLFKTLTDNYNQSDGYQNAELNYLYKTMAEMVSSSEYIQENTKISRSKAIYPRNDLGRRLKTIAELINSGINTNVYYAAMSGFDTHARQAPQQNKLLSIYSEALLTFVHDLKANNKLDDVLILTFSEFGRRVKQNGSGGTDHGTANNVFLVGGKLKKPGFYNEAPDLSTLDQGDLIHTVDFRSIYATLLSNWLDVDDQKVLGGKFDKLGVV